LQRLTADVFREYDAKWGGPATSGQVPPWTGPPRMAGSPQTTRGRPQDQGPTGRGNSVSILVLEVDELGSARVLSAVLRVRRVIADGGLEGLQLAAAVGRYEGLADADALAAGCTDIERTREEIERLWREEEPAIRALLDQEDAKRAKAHRKAPRKPRKPSHRA
jgi:hypothetical protein